MSRLFLAIGVTAAISCSPLTPAGASPTGAATSIESPLATPRPTASMSPPLALTGRIAARPTAVPSDHRYIAGAEATVGRIWLVDLIYGTSVDVVAAKGEGAQSYFAPTFSESADGRRLLVGAIGANERAALYLVEVESGTVRMLYEDPTFQCGGCVRSAISSDGDRYAFADGNGVRVGPTSGGPTIQLVPHVDRSLAGGTWSPLGWSPDDSWLALGRGSEVGSEIGVVRVGTGALVTVGSGSEVAWRDRSPRLVVTNGINMIGGHSEMYTFEPSTGQRHQLEPVAMKRFASPIWHPTEDRVLFLATDGPYAEADPYVRALADASATQLAAPRMLVDAWWSRDGLRTFGLARRQDAIAHAPGVANLEVLELPSGRVVATVCRQDPRALCP